MNLPALNWAHPIVQEWFSRHFTGANRVLSLDARSMRAVAEGMVAPADLELLSYADDAEGAWQELVRRGLKAGPRPPGYPSKIT